MLKKQQQSKLFFRAISIVAVFVAFNLFLANKAEANYFYYNADTQLNSFNKSVYVPALYFGATNGIFSYYNGTVGSYVNPANDTFSIFDNGSAAQNLRVWKGSSDYLGINNNSIQRYNNQALFINPSGGNVGIGTTTASTKLYVNGGTGDSINVNGGYVMGLNSTPVNADQAVPLGYLQANYAPTSTIAANSFWSGSLTGNVYNANTGNIGVGVTNPATLLDLGGGINYTNVNEAYQMSSSTAKIIQVRDVAQSSLNLVSDTDSNGSVIGSISFSRSQGQTDAHRNVAGLRAIQTNGGGGTTTRGGQLEFWTKQNGGPSVKMVINEGGNVGIGTTAPSQKLHVLNSGISNVLTETSLASSYSAFTAKSDGGNLYMLSRGTAHTGTTFGYNNANTSQIYSVSQPLMMGTYLANDLIIGTNNTERIRVLSNGNVGIGTTNPGVYKLNVAGNSYFSGTVNGMYFSQGAGNFDQGLRVPSFSGYSLVGLNTTNATGTNADSFWMIYNNSESSTNFGFNGYQKSTTAFSVNKSNVVSFTNNVGIGITNPSNKLGFSASTTEAKIGLNGGYVRGLTITPIDDTDAVSRKYLHDNFAPIGINSSAFIQNGNSFGTTATLGTNDNNHLNFETNNATRMTIYNNGNVGIGTTNPNAKLNINNNIAFSVASLATAIDNRNAFRIRGRDTAVNTLVMGSLGVNDYVIQNINDAGTAANNILINPFGGNVGIGTTNPLYKLHSIDTINSDNLFRKTRLGVPAVNDTFDIFNAHIGGTNGVPFSAPFFKIGGKVTTVGASLSNVDVSFFQNTTSTGVPFEALTIKGANGNIGIGLSNPGSKLTIAGDTAFSISALSSTFRNSGKISLMDRLSGRQINNNPDFLEGLNGYYTYDNGSSGSITRTLVSDDTAPNSSGRVMQIDHANSGTPGPGLGGFYKSFGRCTGTAVGQCYREGDRIVYRIWAKIPAGYSIGFASNTYGNGSSHNFISSVAGTGNWEEYIAVQQIGVGGTLSTTGFWYISGSTRPVSWQVASVDIIDVDQVADVNRASELNIGLKQDVVLGAGNLLTTQGTFLAVDGGNVGIGITNPSNKLGFSASTTEAKIGLNGGYVRGLTITPIDDTDAVSRKYLHDNFAPIGINSSAFIQNGNSFGTTATLGTNDNNHLNFETNNATRMTIYNNGNVGIGTTSPSYKLDVFASGANDGIKISNAGRAALVISGATYGPAFRFSADQDNQQEGIIEYGNNDRAFVFVTGAARTNQSIQFWANNANKFSVNATDTAYSGNNFNVNSGQLFVQQSTGNVGIGTTSPTTKLDVVGSIRTSGQLISTVANGTAPLAVTSATLVSNLNADLLDGIDSTRIHYLNSTAGEILDANTITAAARIYRTTGGGSNFPVATNNGGILQNFIAYDTNYGYQTFSQVSAGNLYWRTKSAGTWGSWKTIYDSGNLTNSLTANYHVKWNGSSLVNGVVYDNGINIGIGITNPSNKLGFSASTTEAKIGLNGGYVRGLTITPIDDTDAVSRKYLHDNFASAGAAGNVFGTGTASYLPKWTATHTLANSLIYDNGTNLGIGTTAPTGKLEVNGNLIASSIRSVRQEADIAQGCSVSISGGNLVGGGPTYRTQNSYWQITAVGQILTLNCGGWWHSGMSFSGSNRYNVSGSRLPAGFTVERSIDGGTTWINVQNVSNNANNFYNVNLPDAPMIRIIVNSFQSGETQAVISNIKVYELDDYSVSEPFGYTGGGNVVHMGNNIGIGTSTPVAKLGVSGSGRVINIGGGRIGGMDYTPLYDDEAVSLKYLRDNYTSTSTIASGSFWGGSLTGNVYNVNSGNVGIGTTAPIGKFEVNGASSFVNGGDPDLLNIVGTGNLGLKIRTGSGSGNYSAIRFDSLTTELGVFYADANTKDFVFRQSQNTGSMGFDVNKNRYMTIVQGGNVGIGTTTPSSKLHVYGDGYASFGPNTTWAATLRVGGNGNVTTDASVAATNGNLHLDAKAGSYATYLNYYHGTSGVNFGNGAQSIVANVNSTGGAYFLGNVGMGTTNPGTFRLSVIPAASSNGIYTTNARGNLNSLLVENSSGDYKGVLINHLTGSGSGGCGGDGCYGFKFDDKRFNNLTGTYGPSFVITRSGTTTISNLMQIDSHGINAISVSDAANVGIGITNPSYKLAFNASTTEAKIGLNGGYVRGLTITPIDDTDAVSRKYLHDNFAPISINSNAFVQNGNSFGTTATLGTNDNNHLNFETNSATRMTIYNNGNVGIGITNPSYKLQVSGNSYISGELYNLYGKAIKKGNDSTITSDGWYRIAQTSGDRASGMFNVMDMTSSRHQSIFLYASAAYANGGNNYQLSLNILSNNFYGTQAFTKFRLVRGSTYDPVYLEVYVANVASNSVRYILSDNNWDSGWTPVDWTAGSIPSGYTAIEYSSDNISMNVSNNMLLNNYGTMSIGTTTATSSSRLFLQPAGGSTSNVINVNGAAIGGLDLTPINSDQAVPLGYLQNNFTSTSTIAATSFWGGSLTGNVYSKNTGNVGIGTTNPQNLLQVGAYNQTLGTQLPATTTLVLVNNAGQAGLEFVSKRNDAGTTQNVGGIFAEASGGWVSRLHFMTNNNWGNGQVEAMTISGSNVGIGVTNPLQKLQVGTNSSVSSATPDTVSLGASYSNTAGANAKLRLYDSGSGVPYGLGVSSNSFDYMVPSAAAFNWYINGANKMTLNSSGNVGIGTTNPVFNLQVFGSGANYNDGYIAVNPYNQSYPGIFGRFQENNDTGGGNSYFTYLANDMYHVNTGAENSYYVYNQYVDGQALSLNAEGFKFLYADAPSNGVTATATELMTIRSTGNVGIGITNPSNKLGFNASTTEAKIGLNGGYVTGLTIVPVNDSDAVSKKYLHDNFSAGDKWSKGGDTMSNTSSFGTKNYYPVPFITNDTERMRLTEGGNLAIGTSTASVRLHVESLAGPVAYFSSRINSGNYSGYIGNGQSYSLDEFGLYEAFSGKALAAYDTASALLNYGGALFIDSTSHVGIGTSNPGTASLKVVGDAVVTGTLSTQTGSDFAEEFRSASELEPGTVVVMGDLGYKSVKASGGAYDKTVVGIVSDNPSIIAGHIKTTAKENKVVVAMSGVVSVKVTAAGGRIERGDLLTTSSISGQAMKAKDYRSGTIIGKALEDLEGKSGVIKVLVNLQ